MGTNSTDHFERTYANPKRINAEDYDRYRAAALEDGKLFQDFAARELLKVGYPVTVYSSRAYQLNAGESVGGYEFKHDAIRINTGNLYIETGEKARPRPGDYWPAGIYAGNTFYVIGDYDRLYMFATQILKLCDRSGLYRRVENATETSTAFLLPEGDAKQLAAAVFEPKTNLILKRTAEEIKSAARSLFRKLKPTAADLSFDLPFE